MAFEIRRARRGDDELIGGTLLPMIRQGETYALDPKMTRAQAVSYWMGSDREVFVATSRSKLLGTYYIRPNQLGGGKHVCNCGYVTTDHARGRGVARSMCEHSMGYARSQGYLAMQFNFVVDGNEPALKLWRSLGFAVVGRLPQAFKHPKDGYVDALVMFRTLAELEGSTVEKSLV